MQPADDQRFFEPLSLRRLSVAQAEEAARVYRISYDHAHPWLIGMHTPEEDLDFFVRRVFPACEVWGAYAEERLVGLTAFRPGWIDQLYVLPSMFARGLGGRLLAKALEDGERRSLWVFSRNRHACAFYERRGFRAATSPPDAGDGTSEADLLFVSPLS